MLVDYVYNLVVWYEYRNNGYCITRCMMYLLAELWRSTSAVVSRISYTSTVCMSPPFLAMAPMKHSVCT